MLHQEPVDSPEKAVRALTVAMLHPKVTKLSWLCLLQRKSLLGLRGFPSVRYDTP